MRKRRKMTPEEDAEREGQRARQRRFAEILEDSLKEDAELAVVRSWAARFTAWWTSR